MATEGFVFLSTVSLRLVKQPEHRPEFEAKLEKQLREILEIPKTVAVTTMPDSPLWWQRAKAIAEEKETERKYAEEHPECAKSPHGQHEWRFGKCIWCGKEATETTETTISPNTKETPMYLNGELITWDWKQVSKPVQVRAKSFWITHGAHRGDVGQLVAIKRTGYALEESIRASGIPTLQDVWVKVKYPDGAIVEDRFEVFESGQSITYGKPSESRELEGEEKLPARKKWAIEKYYIFQLTDPKRPFQLQYRIEGSWDLKDFSSYEEMRDFILKGEAELPVHATRLTEIVTWPKVMVIRPILKADTTWEQKELGYKYTLMQAIFESEWGVTHRPMWVWRISSYDVEKRESKEVSASEWDLLRGHYGFPKETVAPEEVARFYREWVP